MSEHEIVIYGAGSVGSSVGGWLAPHCPNLSLLSRGDHAAAIGKKGLIVSLKGEKARPDHLPVSVISDLSQRPSAEIVVITVKNYGLAAAAADIKKKLEKEPLIVALQNGVENQKILPKYFSRVIYGIVCYNSWREGPGIVRANRRGPILLGTPDNDPSLVNDLDEVREIFSQGLDARITEDFRNAAVTKMVMNLANSILTLVGHGFRDISSMRALKHIVTGTLLEGIEIASKAGYREAKVPGAPTRSLLRFSALLPESLSDIIFAGNIKKVDLNSMGQDLLQMKRKQTELDSLNGFFIALADSLKMPAPYNRTIYEICRKRFAKTPFVPMDETEVWKEIGKRLGRR